MRLSFVVIGLLSLGCASQRAERYFASAEIAAEKYVPSPDNPFEGITNAHVMAAETDYRRAIELAPRNPKYHHRLGLLLYRSRVRDKGKAEIRAAILIDPLYTDAQADLERIERAERSEQASLEAQRRHRENEDEAERRRRENEEFAARLGEEQRRTDRERELRRRIRE